jgi:hypothetical protein
MKTWLRRIKSALPIENQKKMGEFNHEQGNAGMEHQQKYTKII